jgi:hypothetical protein
VAEALREALQGRGGLPLARHACPHILVLPSCPRALPPLCAAQQLEITFRRDPSNYRPRINKKFSVKDMEQKKAGTYFYLDE